MTEAADPFDIDETPKALELDRTKPFGQVSGDDSGKRFFQDGRYFDYRGRLLPEVA